MNGRSGWRRALAIGAPLAVAIVVATASAIAFLRPDAVAGQPSDGLVTVKLAVPFADGAWCDTAHDFCITAESLAEGYALYAIETHAIFRAQGCTVSWRPDYEYTDIATGDPKTGAFKSGCSGSVFDALGTREYGPAPRDLDRYGLTTEGSHIVVDTRTVVCGRSGSGEQVSVCPRSLPRD
jgi:Rieske Fe-S protein